MIEGWSGEQAAERRLREMMELRRQCVILGSGAVCCPLRCWINLLRRDSVSWCSDTVFGRSIVAVGLVRRCNIEAAGRGDICCLDSYLLSAPGCSDSTRSVRPKL